MNTLNVPFISQSLLNMAAKCMKQVEFRYVKGIRIPPGFAAHRGSAVHKAAQVDAEVKRDSQSETGITIAQMQDIAADEFERRVSEDGVYMAEDEAVNAEKVKGEAKDFAIVAATLYGNEVADRVRKPVMIEQSVSMEVEGLSYPIGGIIDLVHVVNEGNRIRDLKTSAKKPDAHAATQGIQAPLYTMLAEHALGKKSIPFDFEYLVVQKTKQENVTVTASITKAARENVLDRARILETVFETGMFMPAAPGAWWCSEASCGYWGICSHGRAQAVQI